MKTPMKSEQQKHGKVAHHSPSQQQVKSKDEGTGLKKNLLLTPFLLSLPVIIILFSLISGTTAEVPEMVPDESGNNELVINQHSEQLNRVTQKTDSTIKLKTLALPSKK